MIRSVKPSDVLILSGIPGAGKSFYARSLEGLGWDRVSMDEVFQKPVLGLTPLEHAVCLAIGGDDSGIQTRLSGKALVVEWGFHVNDFPKVEHMIRDRGYVGWYFEADRMTAQRGWSKEHPGDITEWTRQVDSLDARSANIDALYAHRRIVTTLRDGTYRTIEDIDKVVRGATPT
jgi:hypothetical protein